ncbi:MAG: pyrroloquinoline quinone biosynthesis peptide chaperone PqqD [Polyangiales bacterium]
MSDRASEELPASSTRYRIASKARLIFDNARGKHMLMYPERGLELNVVAHAILSLCDGRNTVDDIVALLTERFSRTEPETVQRDVRAFLLQLSQRGVLLGEE